MFDISSISDREESSEIFNQSLHSVNFEFVISDKSFQNLFLKFLKSEFNEAPLLFIFEVEEIIEIYKNENYYIEKKRNFSLFEKLENLRNNSKSKIIEKNEMEKKLFENVKKEEESTYIEYTFDEFEDKFSTYKEFTFEEFEKKINEDNNNNNNNSQKEILNLKNVREFKLKVMFYNICSKYIYSNDTNQINIPKTVLSNIDKVHKSYNMEDAIKVLNDTRMRYKISYNNININNNK
jgi:hypothetical protein